MFIAMDEPRHSIQRKTVAPSVAPSNLAEARKPYPRTRDRHSRHLPVGETFNWVEEVSIELTTQMLSDVVRLPVRRPAQARVLVRYHHRSPQLMRRCGNYRRCAPARTAGLRQHFYAVVERARRTRTGERPDLDARARRVDAQHDSRPHGVPRQPDAADRRRQRHDAQLDQRRRARAEQNSAISTRSCARTCR